MKFKHTSKKQSKINCKLKMLYQQCFIIEKSIQEKISIIISPKSIQKMNEKINFITIELNEEESLQTLFEMKFEKWKNKHKDWKNFKNRIIHQSKQNILFNILSKKLTDKNKIEYSKPKKRELKIKSFKR